MAGSGGGPPCPQVAGPTQFGELVPVTTFLVLWVIAWITSGALVAVQLFPLVLIGLLLGGWTLLMRLRFDRDPYRENDWPVPSTRSAEHAGQYRVQADRRMAITRNAVRV